MNTHPYEVYLHRRSTGASRTLCYPTLDQAYSAARSYFRTGEYWVRSNFNWREHE